MASKEINVEPTLEGRPDWPARYRALLEGAYSVIRSTTPYDPDAAYTTLGLAQEIREGIALGVLATPHTVPDWPDALDPCAAGCDNPSAHAEGAHDR